MRTISVWALLALPAIAPAQESPVGLWRNIDDKTKQPKAEIRLVETAGVISGKIEKRLSPDAKPDDRCTKCDDDRKDQPILGLEIIRQVKKTDEPGVWGGGEILDPENGRTYRATLRLVDGGRKLDVRGSFGPFGRTQAWMRAE